jgi:hypothetical protein
MGHIMTPNADFERSSRVRRRREPVTSACAQLFDMAAAKSMLGRRMRQRWSLDACSVAAPEWRPAAVFAAPVGEMPFKIPIHRSRDAA